jgi:hypothetical protein
VKSLVVPLTVLATAMSLLTPAGFAVLARPAGAQTVAPAPATPIPWRPRPVIIIDPRQYLPTPAPGATRRSAAGHHAKMTASAHAKTTASARAKRSPRAAPRRAAPSPATTPETFERIDTSPPPARPPRRA